MEKVSKNYSQFIITFLHVKVHTWPYFEVTHTGICNVRRLSIMCDPLPIENLTRRHGILTRFNEEL